MFYPNIFLLFKRIILHARILPLLLFNTPTTPATWLECNAVLLGRGEKRESTHISFNIKKKEKNKNKKKKMSGWAQCDFQYSVFQFTTQNIFFVLHGMFFLKCGHKNGDISDLSGFIEHSFLLFLLL